MDSASKQRISIYMDRKLVKQADRYQAEAGCYSRNDFVTAAVQHYIAELKLQENDDIFCEKLAAAINKVLEKQTIQISKGLFRYAVELEIIMRMMAESGKFEPETLTAFRREAVNNVRQTRGKVRLDSYFNRKDTESL